MAETPPQGSLLSNFLSGGNVGRTPFGPEPKKKDDWIDPSKLPPDQAAMLGTGVANIGLNSVESLVSGIKEGLVGQGVLKRFGGEDKIVAAAHDYVSTAVNKAGQTELLKELDIDTPEKFGVKYIPFMKAKQAEDNVVRKAEGKPTVEGFGNYEVKVTGRVFINPFRAGKELGKQAVARSARRGLEEMNLGGDHPELSVFTKKELADYTPEFLARLTYSKQQEIKAAIDQNSTASYTYIYHQLDKKFNKLVAEYEQDQKKPVEARSGELSKVGKEVKARIFNKNFIRKAFGKLGEIYGELDRVTKDPIGFAFDYLVKKPLKYFVKKYLLGETKLFGKWLGKGWGSKFSKWLVNRGFLGKALSFVGNQVKFGLEKGLGGLFRKGLFNLGKLVGRLGASLLKATFKTLVISAVRVIAATAVAAASAIAGPVFLVVGGAILALVIGVLIVMFVLAPLNQDLNPAAAAATSDLVISASSSKNSEVSAGETLTLTFSTTAYAAELGSITLKVDLDANLAFPDGSKSQSFPPFTLNKGESKSVSASAITLPQMTTKTVAVINAAATSSKANGFATIYLNRAGNSIGADGKHAYPILQGSNDTWQNCHDNPNYNAIDIFDATPAGGAPVVAVISGRVESRIESLGGPVVYLYGDDGFNYYYAHLNNSGRVSGAVSTGQIIGYIASASDQSAKNRGYAHTHFSIDSRGVHNGPDTPAGDFLNAVGGTSKPRTC